MTAMETDEYVIRVTCDDDGSDETLTLTPEQFEGVRLLVAAVEERHMREGRYWCGPALIVTSKNGVDQT